MPKITKVYTRTGDDGTTALGSRRVAKDDLRVACYGTVDETNSAIGAALASGLDAKVDAMLRRIQNELFHLGSDLWMPEADKPKTPVPTIAAKHVKALEKDIDAMQRALPPLANFVLPGGAPGAAALHVARTTCRRAERLVVELARKEAVGAQVVPYLNRLSDFLFVASRAENRAKGVDEPVWDSRVKDGGWISGDGGPIVVLQSGALPAWRGGSGPEPGLMLGGKVETDYDVICRCDDGGNVVERHGRAMLVLADCEMPASFVASPLGEVVVVQGYVAEDAVAPLLAQAAACPPSHSLPFAMADDRLRLLVGADDSDGTIYGFTECGATPGSKTCDFWWIDGSLVVALRPRA